MFTKPKHLLFAPIYYYQGKRVKQNTIDLPEPKGARRGSFSLPCSTSDKITGIDDNLNDNLNQDSSDKDDKYRLAIIGDSSAAGVGVAHQQQALSMQLLSALAKQSSFSQRYSSIDWQLHATTGHDSFDVLRRLYILPKTEQALDCLIIVVGVNDVTKMRSLKVWQKNLAEIVSIARHKFAPKQIIFTAIPPLDIFPALPYPLNEFIGDKEKQLNQAMRAFCDSQQNISYAQFDLDIAGNNASSSSKIANNNNDTAKKGNAESYFAEDGFHPSALTYKLWAEELVRFIT